MDNIKKIKKIQPMFNHIVTTMHRYEVEQDSLTGVISVKAASAAVKEYQTVIAVGPNAQVKVGDVVCINPKNYARVQQRKKPWGGLEEGKEEYEAIVKYDFPVVTIEGEDYMLLYDSDIDFIVEEYE